MLEISFYTCVPKITTIWCMVPEIHSETDIIFCHSGPFFCPFTPTPLWTQKMKFWKTEKKYLEISSFHTSVRKIMIICYTVSEIRRVTNVIVIFNFELFFALLTPNSPKNQNFKKMKKIARRYYHFTHVHHKWQSYDVWFLRYGAWWTEFFVILDHFLHFYPPNNTKSQNFEKIFKNTWRYYHFTDVYHEWQSHDVWTPGDIITLHMCTVNDNHMMYSSWDMECDGQNFLSFWTIFSL